MRDLTEAQVADGHAVGIVCDSTTGGAFEEKLFSDMEGLLTLGVRRTPMQRHIGPGDIASAYRTYKIIKELQPDVVHGHGAKGGVYARLFGSLLRVSRSRVARLYSPHGGSLHYDEATLTGKFFFSLERLMARFTDHLLFVSDYERRTFKRKIGEPPIPNSLVYNGLREAEFEPVPADAGRRRLPLYRHDARPQGTRPLHRRAGARRASRSGGRSRRDGRRRRRPAEIQGAGGCRSACADRVAFHPPMPARQAFALARIIVVPSRAEAMPYIVLEALAAGMPMIASAVGGIPEIFGPGSPALVRPDAGEIAAAMASAVADIAKYRALMPGLEELRCPFQRGGHGQAYRDGLFRRARD